MVMQEEKDEVGFRVDPKRWLWEDTGKVLGSAFILGVGATSCVGIGILALVSMGVIGASLAATLITAAAIPLIAGGAAMGMKLVTDEKIEKAEELKERQIKSQYQARGKERSMDTGMENTAFVPGLGEQLYKKTKDTSENVKTR